MLIARLIASIIIGYLLGSIPFGVLIGKFYRGVDVRKFGSGRTGATNVLRTLGPGAAALVVIGDVGKGILAVLVAEWIMTGQPEVYLHVAMALAGLAAIGGHTWSIYIRFTGGRGVLVAGGALLMLFPAAVPVCLVAAIIVIAIWRFVSLGSITAVVIAAIWILGFVIAGLSPRPYAAFAIFGAAFIIIQHRDNIERLLAGKERKLGQHAPAPPSGAT